MCGVAEGEEVEVQSGHINMLPLCNAECGAIGSYNGSCVIFKMTHFVVKVLVIIYALQKQSQFPKVQLSLSFSKCLGG